MRCCKSVLVLSVLVVSSNARADDDIKMTPRQKEDLKKLQASLEARPVNPNLVDSQVKDVQAKFQKFLSASHAPSTQSTATLAVTMVQGIHGGRLSVTQSVQLSKELCRMMDMPVIGYGDVNRFVFRVDSLVQSTSLGPTEKLRLYREAMKVVVTAPTYDPSRR